MRKIWEQLSGIAATFERECDVAKSVCTISAPGPSAAELKARSVKTVSPVLLGSKICSLRVLLHEDFRFFQVRLSGGFARLPVPGVGKNHAGVLQFAQQVRMLLRKEVGNGENVALR